MADAQLVSFRGDKIDPATAKALVVDTLIEGNTVSAWWTRQDADFLNGFMDRIRTSVQNGETINQAITRIAGGTIGGVAIPGMAELAKKKAGALVSSALNAVANEARLKTFQANNDVVKGIQQVSTLDNRTSDTCIAYSGKAWDVETLEPIDTGEGVLPFNGGPPRHFNCRSTLVPVLKSFKELGIDLNEIPPGTRASMDGQVPGNITFDAWLKTKSTSFQDKLLGPTKAGLWRDNKITLTQLVDMRGRPLTVKQLEAKVGLVSLPVTPKPQPALLPSTVAKQDFDKAISENDFNKAESILKQESASGFREIGKLRVENKKLAIEQKVTADIADFKANTAPNEFFSALGKKVSSLSGYERAEFSKQADQLIADIKVARGLFSTRVEKALAQKGYSKAEIDIAKETIDTIRNSSYGEVNDDVINSIAKVIENKFAKEKFAIETLKDANQKAEGPVSILNLIEGYKKQGVLVSPKYIKEAEHIGQLAIKKSAAGTAAVIKELEKSLLHPLSGEDVKAIEADLKAINKKPGKAQMKALINSMKAKIETAKAPDVAVIPTQPSSVVDWDAKVKQYLTKSQMTELDEAVTLFKNDVDSIKAKDIVLKLKTNLPDAGSRSVSEYIHKRVNPKTLAIGDKEFSFDAVAQNFINQHFNNAFRDEIQAQWFVLEGKLSKRELTLLRQTIYTRTGIKNIEELGVVNPNQPVSSAVVQIRKKLELNGDYNEIPLDDSISVEEAINSLRESAYLTTDSGLKSAAMQAKTTLSQNLKRWVTKEKNGISPEEWADFFTKNPKLEDWELAAVRAYTQTFYQTLNSALRTGNTGRQLMGTAKAMNLALDKLPKLTGTVFRGAHTRAGYSIDYIEARYAQGSVVTERNFFSTSANVNASFGGEIRFVINATGKNGAIVSPISSHTGEREVLFKAGTKFKIEKVDRKPGKITVYMTEL